MTRTVIKNTAVVKNKILFISCMLVIGLASLAGGCGGGSGDTSGSGDGGGSGGGGGSTGSKGYALTAWNDLGMHCMDSDYSVFSILPPYNNINAQLVKNGKLITQNVKLNYSAIPDTAASINTSSRGKTNFWSNAQSLFGVSPVENTGLTGNKAPSKKPQVMVFNNQEKWFEATGVPLTPTDDAGKNNPYPMLRVSATDNAGKTLASADIVTPVSTEMNCKACHASTTEMTFASDAEPQAGWVFDANPEKDFRRNILRLHDEQQVVSQQYTQQYKNALATQGYDVNGLLATADAGKSILCASCHQSNALPGTGINGIPSLTQVLHSKHADVPDPLTGVLLSAQNDRAACYQCHPGNNTQCLRGAMGDATDANGHKQIECQSCHGNLQNVGSKNRQGWLDEPNCQSCHHDGLRNKQAVDVAGNLRSVSDKRFATNADTPAPGISLYRLSTGHGKLQCEACHGSTHAIFPSGKANDNVYSKKLQGHTGTIAECGTCHETVPKTSYEGPHGMHSVSNWWVDAHGDLAEHNTASCAACHGADFRGSPLSEVTSKRQFVTEDYGLKTFNAGHQSGCYDCHNGPSVDDLE